MRALIILLIPIIFLSCNSKNKDSVSYGAKASDNETASEHPGKKLMETNCYVCHSPTAGHDDRIGPPMIAIKKHYITSETSKKEFIASMQAWIKNPNEEDAKMRGAVRRFGVMPKQYFPEATIDKISDYMFDNNIEQPEWFDGHFNEKMGKGKGNGQGMGQGKGAGKGNGMGQGQGKQQAQTDFEDLPYGERGLKYALTTKAVLGKNLMGTIQKKGTLEALAFCNESAYPLTDSMAVIHNATIKRVSDKPRNIENKANAKELNYIEDFKLVVSKKQEPKAMVETIDEKVHVYYPIVTNNMCLQCHGKPNQDIQPLTLAKIKSLYPRDKAVGYGVNEVRGIWSISFDN